VLVSDVVFVQMQNDAKDFDKIVSVAERAIRNCPWSGDIRTLYAGIYVSFRILHGREEK